MKLTRVVIDCYVEGTTCCLAKLILYHILYYKHRTFRWQHHRWFCPSWKNFNRKLCIILLVVDKRFIPRDIFRCPSWLVDEHFNVTWACYIQIWKKKYKACLSSRPIYNYSSLSPCHKAHNALPFSCQPQQFADTATCTTVTHAYWVLFLLSHSPLCLTCFKYYRHLLSATVNHCATVNKINYILISSCYDLYVI